MKYRTKNKEETIKKVMIENDAFLFKNGMRFNEILEEINTLKEGGMSKITLSRVLKNMEKAGTVYQYVKSNDGVYYILSDPAILRVHLVDLELLYISYYNLDKIRKTHGLEGDDAHSLLVGKLLKYFAYRYSNKKSTSDVSDMLSYFFRLFAEKYEDIPPEHFLDKENIRDLDERFEIIESISGPEELVKLLNKKTEEFEEFLKEKGQELNHKVF